MEFFVVVFFFQKIISVFFVLAIVLLVLRGLNSWDTVAGSFDSSISVAVARIRHIHSIYKIGRAIRGTRVKGKENVALKHSSDMNYIIAIGQ